MAVAEAIPSAGGISGSKTVGESAVALTALTERLDKGIQIKADKNNSGTVYVGFDVATLTADGGDTTTGFPIDATEGIWLPADLASGMAIIGSAAGQKVFFIGM